MIRTTLVLLSLLGCAMICTAQYHSAPDSAALKRYGASYRHAQYTGGDEALRRFIARNMRYPDAARENDIQGRTIVCFKVDSKGNASDARIVRSVGGGCDEEAIRIVKAMPAWQPALYKKKAVTSFVTLPIVFKLE